MSSSKRAPPKKKEPPSCPGWMMTFGDSMSLLVTFFVMMIAFSSLEEAKLAAMVGVLRGAFGAVDVRMSEGAVESMAITDVDKSIPDSGLDHAIRGESPDLRFLTAEEMADALPDFINEIRQHSADVLSDRLLIQILDEGLSIILQTTDIFEKGSTDLTQDCQPLWQGIASLLLGRNNDLRITSVTSASAPVQASVAANQIPKAIIAIARARFSMCWPAKTTGAPWNRRNLYLPESLPKAMTEPENVIAPTKVPMNSSIRLPMGMGWPRSTMLKASGSATTAIAMNTAARPIMECMKATSSGILVISTRLAMIVPIVPPTSSPSSTQAMPTVAMSLRSL